MVTKKEAEAIIAVLKKEKKEVIIALGSALAKIENGEWESVSGLLQIAVKHTNTFQESETAYRRYYSKQFGSLDLKKL